MNDKDKKIGIKTQQGFSQHILWLTEEDAKVYIKLLERNYIWYHNLTTNYTFIPNTKKQYPPNDLFTDKN